MFADSTLRLIGGCVFGALLLIACAGDLRSRRIPNKLVLVILSSGLAFSLLTRPLGLGLRHAVGGIVVGFVIWFPFHLMRLLGAGDVKLFAAAGAWLGAGATFKAAILAAAAGGVLALAILPWQRDGRAAMLNVATWTATMRQQKWVAPVPVSQARFQLPYAVPLAIGAALAAWFPGLIG